MECRECGKQVSTRAVACSHCGEKPAVEIKAAVSAKPKGPRWSVILLITVGAIVVGAIFAGNPKVPEKTSLAKLCDQRWDNEEKFRNYWNKGNVDYAADVSRELQEIKAKIEAYKPEEVARTCGGSVPAASPPAAVAKAAAVNDPAVPALNPEPSTGCTAPPFEVLPLGKPLTVPELTTLIRNVCRTSFTSPDRPVEIQWQDKTYQVGFVKSSRTDGIERYEVKSIRAQ